MLKQSAACELLEAIRGRGTLHVLHAHGNHVFFDRMLDYPVHTLSWADQDAGPTLAEARRRTDLALMGGISQGRFAYESAGHIRQQIRRAIEEAGREKLFLAPGCALPSYSFPELIRAAHAAAAR